MIKSQVLYQLSYAPTALLLNNLPHRTPQPTDFLPVVHACGTTRLGVAPSRAVVCGGKPSPQESLHA